MGRLFKTHISSKQDVKSTLTSVIEVKKSFFHQKSSLYQLFNYSWRKTCLQIKQLY